MIEELKDTLLDCYSSTKAMAEVFFPEHCYRPFGAAHEPIFEILDNDSIRLSLIVCPRGWGKTTLSGLIFPAKKALYRDCHYIVYISSTATKAIGDVQTLAKELQQNEMVTKVFGNLKGLRWAEGTGEIELSSDIKIEAKGAGQQIRGIKFGKWRPDLIIIDDLEDPEKVDSQEQRAKLKKWFFADVLNSVDLERTRVIMLGTILHEDSLIANILDESKWGKGDEAQTDDDKLIEKFAEKFMSIRIEACNDRLEATWPDFMSTDRIRAKYIAYKRRGLLPVFYREFRNLIVPDEGGRFSKDKFKYFKDSSDLNRLDNVVLVDPAKTRNKGSDETAILGVAFDSVKNKIYERDCIHGKIEPKDIYKEACDMADRLGTYVIGVEVEGLNEFITFPFRSYIATRPRHYELVELKTRGRDKDARIAALAPFYSMGAIYHNERAEIHEPLESQLIIHPNGRLKDVADCFAYLIEMFDIGERLFSMEVDSSTDELRKKAEEDEFEILKKDDYEESFKDWQYAC